MAGKRRLLEKHYPLLLLVTKAIIMYCDTCRQVSTREDSRSN